MGRTGTLWAYEQIGVEPDAMTVAKALGGGLPIGALVTGDRGWRTCFQPGDHGSTFAGGPVIAAAALAALKVTDDPALLAGVRELGQLLADALEAAAPCHRRARARADARLRARPAGARRRAPRAAASSG